MKKKITNREEIELLVDTFYGKVQKDDLIGPIFDRVIEDRWPHHLQKMYQFWETILFEDQYTYRGRPFPPHISLGLTEEHFDRWLSLFTETLAENFEADETTEKAQKQAQTMATLFQSKLAYFREQGSTPIL